LDEVALRDHERTEWLKSQGYSVIRFTNRQVEADVFAVVEEVKRRLARSSNGIAAPREPA